MSFNFQSLFGGGAASGPRVESMSAPTAVQFHGDKNTVFIDVRSLGEIQMSGTIKGALRIPLDQFARHARPEGGGGVPPATAGKRIILVCASGARSGAAASQLVAAGHAEVANLVGGFSAWARAGGPVER